MLGAQVKPDGTPSDMLADRIADRRDAVLRAGTVDSRCSRATWDSAQRAQRVFGVDSAIVVTQRFHLPRALFAARRAGLDATGFAADRSASEAVARPKAETEGASWAGCSCARRSRA